MQNVPIATVRSHPARLKFNIGEAKDADQYLKQALDVLEAMPPGPELAMAYAPSDRLTLWNTGEKAIWRHR